MTRLAPQEILKSKTKWYLGGGREVIWAPEFPQHLDTPGFWDHATYREWKVEPMYTMTLLDEDLHEIPLRLKDREWVPSKLTQIYETINGISVVEEKCLLPNDVMLSKLRLKNTGKKKRKLTLVMWTYHAVGQKDVPGQYRTGHQMKNDVFSHEVVRYDENGKDIQNIFVAMSAKQKVRSWAVNSSERVLGNQPTWLFSPANERMTPKGLDNSFIVSSGERKDSGNTSVYAAMDFAVTLNPGAAKAITTACTIASSKKKSLDQLSEGLAFTDPIKVSCRNWDDFFRQVPEFECSDKYISKYYWYRWYGIKLNIGIIDHENNPYPFVHEGMNPGWFRQHISYSAHCHMLETRWMHDPAIAQGSILNFVHNQAKDGSYTGAISNRKGKRHAFMYHANWGLGVRKLYESHPDKDFLKKVYPSLEKYIRYFDKARDREKSGLYDVNHQGETGQEYMSRYFFVDKDGDQWGELKPHLKGVDATVYIYELVKTMAWMAGKLGLGGTVVKKWESKAEKIKRAVLDKMWDSRKGYFCDVHPKTMRKSPIKSSVLFYPFMTDIVGEKHLKSLYDHLLNPKEFWTKYPCPSTSIDDKWFSEYGEWKGQRKHCTWAGRSWLMTNSHIAEALAIAAETLDTDLTSYAAEFIRKFFHMPFIDGDIDLPTSYEYYHPFNGKAPFFRGVDDYMHSWMNELVLKYICGVKTSDDNTVTIKPLDFGLSHFTLDNLKLRGRKIKVKWQAKKTDSHPIGLTIYVSRKKVHHSPSLEKAVIKL